MLREKGGFTKFSHFEHNSLIFFSSTQDNQSQRHGVNKDIEKCSGKRTIGICEGGKHQGLRTEKEASKQTNMGE
jgi:hypothetical protein